MSSPLRAQKRPRASAVAHQAVKSLVVVSRRRHMFLRDVLEVVLPVEKLPRSTFLLASRVVVPQALVRRQRQLQLLLRERRPVVAEDRASQMFLRLRRQRREAEVPRRLRKTRSPRPNKMEQRSLVMTWMRRRSATSLLLRKSSTTRIFPSK